MTDSKFNIVAPQDQFKIVAPDPPPPQSSIASLGRNFVAGAEEGVTSIPRAATETLEAGLPFLKYQDELEDWAAKALGHPNLQHTGLFDITEGGINRGIGYVTGINPDEVHALTPEERIARTAGQGSVAIAIPGGEDAAIVRLLKGIASGTAGGFAQEVAPERYKKAAGIVASLLAGYGLTARTSMTPEEETAAASKYVAGRAKASGATPASLRGYAQDPVRRGKPVTAAEGIGPRGEVAAAALARREGTTAKNMTDQLRERNIGTRERMLDDFATHAGIDPRAAEGDIDTLVEEGRKDAKPLFDAVRNRPGGVWNDVLARLAKRDVIKKALALAAADLRNADKDPVANGLVFDEEGNLQQVAHPTAEAWDLAKKNLNGMIERDVFHRPVPDLVSRGNHNIGVSDRDLTEQLKQVLPGYREALAKSGDYLASRSAFDDGAAMVTNDKISAAKFSKHISDMDEAELKAMRGGIANKFFEMAGSGRLTPRFLAKPVVRAKLFVALGPQAASEFIKRVEQEAAMLESASGMMPRKGSQTQPLSEAMADQDAAFKSRAGDALELAHAGYHMAHGNPIFIVRKVMSALDRAGLFGREGTMPIAVRNQAGELLLMSPEELAHHLETSPALRTPQAITHLMNFVKHMGRAARVSGAPILIDLFPTQQQQTTH